VYVTYKLRKINNDLFRKKKKTHVIHIDVLIQTCLTLSNSKTLNLLEVNHNNVIIYEI